MGEDDGTQMFSVNGRCALRGGRKFKPKEFNSNLLGDAIEEDTEKNRKTEYEGLEEDGTIDEQNAIIHPEEKIDTEVEERTESFEKMHFDSTSSSKLDKTSRNPVTGEGVETAENMSRQQKKHFGKHHDKWLW